MHLTNTEELIQTKGKHVLYSFRKYFDGLGILVNNSNFLVNELIKHRVLCCQVHIEARYLNWYKSKTNIKNQHSFRVVICVKDEMIQNVVFP